MIDPVPAFVGAIVASLALGIMAVARRGIAGLDVSRPGLRTAAGIVLWVAVVGAFTSLAIAWSDFGSP